MADPDPIGEFIAQDDPAPACDGLLDDIADALEGVPDGPWTPLMHDVHDRALIVTNVAAPPVLSPDATARRNALMATHWRRCASTSHLCPR